VRKIFVAYRRATTAGHAGRLHDRLESIFGIGSIFLDTMDIPSGETFESFILTEIEKCQIRVSSTYVRKSTLEVQVCAKS
jgi:hypothetical protein